VRGLRELVAAISIRWKPIFDRPFSNEERSVQLGQEKTMGHGYQLLLQPKLAYLGGIALIVLASAKAGSSRA
jgi:hypothetical protein